MTADLLRGRRILLTRPAQANAALADALRARGAEPVELPLFRIAPAGEDAALAAALDTQREADGWIFTSVHAVDRAAALDRGAWPALYAIGAATAQRLAEHGHPGAHIAAGSDSEALLALPALQSVRGQHWLLCSGHGGRDRLESVLRTRGAQVRKLALYRRVAVDYDAAQLAAALQDLDAIVCTSGEGVQRLHALAAAQTDGGWRALPLVVPSARVLELARGLGFVDPRAPAQMSHDALLQCLVEILARRPAAGSAQAPRPP